MRYRMLCNLCGEVIGVYEPVTVARGNWVRATSLVLEPELSDAAGVRRYHDQCAKLVFEGNWAPRT